MQTETFSPSGVIVNWSLTATNRLSLIDLFEQHGYGAFAPPVTGDSVALKKALEQYKGKSQIVRPHKRPGVNGYEVVNEERIAKRCGANSYNHSFSAWVDEGKVDIGYGAAAVDTQRLNQLFQQEKALVSPTAVGERLGQILDSFQPKARTLYPGTRWLPNKSVPLFEPIAKGLEGLDDGNRVRCLVTTLSDPETFRDVKESLVRDIMKAKDDIAERIASGDLSEAQISNQREKSLALHGEIEEYETILNEGLSDLHAAVAEVERAATHATLQVAASTMPLLAPQIF